MHFTDRLARKLSSVQSIPMKHCAEYSVWMDVTGFHRKQGNVYRMIGTGLLVFVCENQHL